MIPSTRTFSPFCILSLSAAVLAIAAFSVPMDAHAQDEDSVYFYPAQSWSVQKNGDSCGISTQFNNGFIMRFGGDKRWVQGMDVDFRQSIFDVQKTYTMRLSVPGVKAQEFQASTPSEQTLSISLFRQKEFYKTLRSSSVLDMDVEGNEFRFYLTGFDQSADEFEQCMAGAARAEQNNFVSEAQPENFLVNESIAFEEQAKVETVPPVVDVVERDIAPVVQEIPFNETRKVGDIEVPSEARVATDTAPTEFVPPVPITNNKRLSEQLAEQIQDDPSLYAVNNERPLAPSERKSLDVPENLGSVVPIVEENIPEKLTVPSVQDDGIPELFEPIDAPVEDEVEIVEISPPIAVLEPAPVTQEPEAVEIAEMPVQTDADAIREKALAQLNEERKPAAAEESLIQDPPMDNADMASALIEAPSIQTQEVVVEDFVAPELPVAEPPAAALTPIKEVEPVEAVPPAPAPIVKTAKTQPIKVKRDTLSGEVDFTAAEPTARDPAARELRKQVLELEDTLAALRAENQALDSELKASLRESEEERLSIASENWNLEQATMKFNEAERQIKRLGQQLQRERAMHNQEKRELESMLFDPQVTNDAQLARLADLESQLMKMRQDMESQRLRYEQQLRAVQGR